MRLPLRIERFLARRSILDRNVIHRHSDRTVQEKLQDPSFPVLISFPRTGSHQLRLLMEYYFRIPSLPRIFYYKKAREFTCCHMHDLHPPDRPAGVERKRVIYLYRDPIPTVHSVMRYYGENVEDPIRIEHWSALYRGHLNKWLLQENFTEAKTSIRYEALQKAPWPTFEKLCSFFGASREAERFKSLFQGLTKEQVMQEITDAASIKGNEEEGEWERERFRKEAGPTIEEAVFGKNPALLPWFDDKKEGP
ncbi:MAG: hypothetical protein ABEH38_06645 [Flavobacteriales bacterium]